MIFHLTAFCLSGSEGTTSQVIQTKKLFCNLAEPHKTGYSYTVFHLSGSV